MLMISKQLLALLAPIEPINQDEMGGCVWCGGTPPRNPYGYAGRFLSDHLAGCAWVKARKIVGDKIPKSRNGTKRRKRSND